MPKFFDDYSNTYLTHDSSAGRKQQRRGWKFRENFRIHYEPYVDAWRRGPMGLASAQQAFIKARGSNDPAIPPLPEGWKEQVDDVIGITYYIENKTGKRTWVRPAGERGQPWIPPPPGRGGGGPPPSMGGPPFHNRGGGGHHHHNAPPLPPHLAMGGGNTRMGGPGGPPLPSFGTGPPPQGAGFPHGGVGLVPPPLPANANLPPPPPLMQQPPNFHFPPMPQGGPPPPM